MTEGELTSASEKVKLGVDVCAKAHEHHPE